MHRIVVKVQHWMTDKQFAEAFAISQLSPGPNVLIVILIGDAVAGVVGALAATFATGIPTAVPILFCEALDGAFESVALAGGFLGFAGVIRGKPLGRFEQDNAFRDPDRKGKQAQGLSNELTTSRPLETGHQRQGKEKQSDE